MYHNDETRGLVKNDRDLGTGIFIIPGPAPAFEDAFVEDLLELLARLLEVLPRLLALLPRLPEDPLLLDLLQSTYQEN